MIHFRANTYQMQVKRISCDKEIGSVKNGWHVCNAKAHAQYFSKFGNLLHYCKKHAPYGSEEIK